MARKTPTQKPSYARLFKTVAILFEKLGENQTTAATPRRAYVAEVDAPLLNAQVHVCVSSDNDMLVAVNRYQVHDVTIPVWMTPEEFCQDHVRWEYTWAAGIDPRWPEHWQRAFLGAGMPQRHVAGKLLSSDLRSAFRAEAADRIVAWLSTPPGERKYPSPLSGRHWSALTSRYDEMEATRIAEDLYWSRSKPHIGIQHPSVLPVMRGHAARAVQPDPDPTIPSQGEAVPTPGAA